MQKEAWMTKNERIIPKFQISVDTPSM